MQSWFSRAGSCPLSLSVVLCSPFSERIEHSIEMLAPYIRLCWRLSVYPQHDERAPPLLSGLHCPILKDLTVQCEQGACLEWPRDAPCVAPHLQRLNLPGAVNWVRDCLVFSPVSLKHLNLSWEYDMATGAEISALLSRCTSLTRCCVKHLPMLEFDTVTLPQLLRLDLSSHDHTKMGSFLRGLSLPCIQDLRVEQRYMETAPGLLVLSASSI